MHGFRITWEALPPDPHRAPPLDSTGDFRLQTLNLSTPGKNPAHGCRRSDMVKIIPEPSATRNAVFRVIRSITEIAITPPRIARLHSNLVQFHYVTGDTLQMFKVKVTS